jgi:hypothetical protein
MNMVTNGDGDTGRFKVLCDWEHDDPEQAPTYRNQRLVNLCGVLWVTPETARELECEET